MQSTMQKREAEILRLRGNCAMLFLILVVMSLKYWGIL